MPNEPNANDKLCPNLKNETKNGAVSQQKTSGDKPKLMKNKCDLGPDFVAPDGGWGWLVVIAAGVSNVSSKKLHRLAISERMQSIQVMF